VCLDNSDKAGEKRGRSDVDSDDSATSTHSYIRQLQPNEFIGTLEASVIGPTVLPTDVYIRGLFDGDSYAFTIFPPAQYRFLQFFPPLFEEQSIHRAPNAIVAIVSQSSGKAMLRIPRVSLSSTVSVWSWCAVAVQLKMLTRSTLAQKRGLLAKFCSYNAATATICIVGRLLLRLVSR